MGKGEVILEIGEDNVFRIKEEPYCVLEFPSEKDYVDFEKILETHRGFGQFFKEGHVFTSQKGGVSFGSYEELKKLIDEASKRGKQK